jgi:hypothetical protein
MSTHVRLRRATLILILCPIALPAIAATNSYTFTVSATVVATCSVAPRLPSNPGAAVAAASRLCAPATGLSTRPVVQPVVTVARDPTGLTTLTIEF